MRHLKKIIILLAIISIAALTITAVAQTISGESELSMGIILTLVGIVALWFVITSFSKRRITFTRVYLAVLLSGLFILITSAYLDINSPSDIKNSFISALGVEKGQFRSKIDLVVQRTELKLIELAEVEGEGIEYNVEEPADNNQTSTDVSKKPGQTTDTKKYVRIDGALLAGADGHLITLSNNLDAVNPSWAELKSFLLNDDTDRLRYDFATFVCADFAERVHNKAEKAGIRAALVSIQLGPCSYYPIGGGHALNAFETTDRGLVFIDCTSSNQGVNADKIVVVEVGKDYIPRSIFPEPGWDDVWVSMGKVVEIETVQW